MASPFAIQRRVPLIASGGFSDLNSQRFGWNQQNLQTIERNRSNLENWIWRVGEARRQREERNRLAADARQNAINEDRRFKYAQKLQALERRDRDEQRRRDRELEERAFQFGVAKTVADDVRRGQQLNLQAATAAEAARLREAEIGQRSEDRRFGYARQSERDFDDLFSSGGYVMPKDEFERLMRSSVSPSKWSYYRNAYENNRSLMRNQYDNAIATADQLNRMQDAVLALSEENPEAAEETLNNDRSYQSLVKSARDSGIIVQSADGSWHVRVAPQIEAMMQDSSRSFGPPRTAPAQTAAAPTPPEAPEPPVAPQPRDTGGIPSSIPLGSTENRSWIWSPYGSQPVPKSPTQTKPLPIPMLPDGKIDRSALVTGTPYINPRDGSILYWNGTKLTDET